MLDTSKIPVERIEGYNNHITNCITKIPQDIKLELVDSTLTLKAGSKVYVPNGKNADGSNRFDEVVIPYDLSLTSLQNRTGVLYYSKKGAIYIEQIDRCYSGSSYSGGQYGLWYDTTNNKIGYTGDNGSSWSFDDSLPLAICTVTTNGVTSIDQVFNGFGYIGNTIFVLPGVEGLIPNGFNDDGSLNNILCTINDVKIANTIAGWNNHWYLHLLNENSIAYHPYELYFNQTSSPISMGQTSYWYNPNENMIYYTDDFGITWNSNRKITPFLDIIQDQEKIISITPKLVYQNNTKNDFNKKFQVVSELPTTPEVGVFYFVKE